jgi:RHS repeat-associated protein
LRISKAANGVTTRYLWGADGLVEEGNFRYERVNGIVTGIGGERITHDGLGSVSARIGAGGLNTYRIDAWGGFRNGTGPGLEDPSLGFAGMHAEAGVGVSYAQQRWYDERTGRFLSEDPVFGDLGNPMSLHRWVYANGNPGRFIDPLGLNPLFNYWDLKTKPIEELKVIAKIEPFYRILSDEKVGQLDSDGLISYICFEDRCDFEYKPSFIVHWYSQAKNWIFDLDDLGRKAGREQGAEVFADLGINPKARNRWEQVPGDSTPQSEGPSYYTTREELGAEIGEFGYEQGRDALLTKGAVTVLPAVADGLKFGVKKKVAARGEAHFIQGVKVKSHGKVIAEGTVDLKPTLERIRSGGSFAHKNDGSVFKNLPPKGSSQPLLPEQPLGYYREYVHPTPGVNGPGPQRVVVGQGGEIYYTPDHYESFILVN